MLDEALQYQIYDFAYLDHNELSKMPLASQMQLRNYRYNKRNRHKLCVIFYCSKTIVYTNMNQCYSCMGVILLMEPQKNHFKMKTKSEGVNCNKGFARVSPESHEICTYNFRQSRLLENCF